MDFYTILRGGLGNQLFQYAFMKSLEIKYSARLFFDLNTGFILDRQVRREYELEDFKIFCQSSLPTRAISFFIGEKLYYRVSPELGRNYFRMLSTRFISEDAPRYIQIEKIVTKKNFVSGYWQSPRYFIDIWSQISDNFDLKIEMPLSVRELSSRMNSQNSVAIGIRNYSDSRNPSFHARGGRMVSLDQWKKVVARTESELNHPNYYIFSLESTSDFLESLGISRDRVYFVPREISPRSSQRLFLFASCKHHVFNNSSFYWWGAFLRQNYFENSQQKVYASNNFLNEDFKLENWETF